MTSLLDDLNPEQAAAVRILEGPLCVVAGAGSGNTRRIANLIAHGVRPGRILGVTFTNKAAREMQERVLALTTPRSANPAPPSPKSAGPAAAPGGEERAPAPLVTTFHSLGARILRTDAKRIGLDPAFTIYDRDESVELMKAAMTELGVPTDFASPHAILEHLSALRNSRPGALVPFPGRVWKTFEDDVARVRTGYEDLLRRSNALDFDDLLIQAVRLLDESEEALAAWRRRFTFVLVDEFQDTNWHQYRLARLLTEKSRNLCVTGDPDQSIYSWRGADPRNFADFRADYPEAREVVLAQNYRSTGAILRCASNVMEPAPDRVHKALWSDLGEGEPVLVVRFGSDREEAADIATRVVQWIRAGDFGREDVAIMFRINALTLPFERELLARGVPYRVVGGPSFFGRAEVKDLVAYLRVLANPFDSLALLRVLNVPPRGIGDKTRDALLAAASEARVPLREIVARRVWPAVPRKSAEALDRFADLLDQLGEIPTAPVRRILETIVSETGYAEWWKERGSRNPSIDPQRNIDQLVSFAYDFDQQHQGPLQAFLEQSALLTDTDRDEPGAEKVTLLTIHAAKGLEFGAVVVVGVEDDLLPHATTASTPAGVDEERRLLHVAMTRAKRRLILTCAASRTRFGRDQSSQPSRFLKDLGTAGIAWQGGGSMSGRPVQAGIGIELEPDPDDPLLNLRKGARIRHPEYGVGTVTGVRSRQRGLDAIVSACFSDGTERAFGIRYAGLSVVEEPEAEW
jgi:DNA helicase-2/ATP-dependent DNA helicase PcrA